MASTFEGLGRYFVSLAERPLDYFTTTFSCWAEDFDHAVEQAENAYPNYTVVGVFKWEN